MSELLPPVIAQVGLSISDFVANADLVQDRLATLGAGADTAGASSEIDSLTDTISKLGDSAVAAAADTTGAFGDIAGSTDDLAASSGLVDEMSESIGKLGDSAVAAAGKTDAAFGDIGAAAKGAAAETDEAAATSAGANDAAADSHTRLGSAATAAASLIKVAGLGIFAAGAYSVDAATKFQGLITTLSTGAGESQSNLAMVASGIEGMAGKVGESTTALANGMYLIESAGYHGAAGLSVLQAAAEGARVGNANLATVADAVTTGLTDYHTAGYNAAQVTSALVQTVADGKTNMEDLGSSLGKVMPQASALGVSFQQVTGAMATMTNTGLSARLAAQHLSNTILALAAPSAGAQKAMQSVGLTAQQVKNEMDEHGLSGALALVSNAVGKTFPAGSVAGVNAMKTLMGGATGYSTALMLTGANSKAFTANVNNIGAALKSKSKDVQGFGLATKDAGFTFESFKDGLEGAATSLGTTLLPAVMGVVKELEGPLQMVFKAMAPVLASLTPVIGELAGTIGKVLATALTTAAPAISDIAGMLGTVMAAAQPLIPMIGGLLAAVVPLFGPVSHLVGELAGALGPALAKLMPPIIAVAGILAGALGKAVNSLAPALTTVVTILGNTLAPILDDLVPLFQAAAPALADMIANLAPVITTLLPPIAELIQLLVSALAPILKALMPIIIPLLPLFIGMSNPILGIGLAVGELIHIMGPLGGMFSAIGHILSGMFIGALHGVEDGFSAMWKFLSGIPSKIVGLFSKAGSWLLEAGKSIIRGLILGLEYLTPMGLIYKFHTQITDFFAKAGSWLLQAGKDIFHGLIEGLEYTNPFYLIWEFKGDITNFFKDAVHWLEDAGRDIMHGLENGLKDAAEGPVNAIKDVAGKMKNAITHPWSIFSPSAVAHGYGQYIMQGLANGITDGKSLPVASLDNLNLVSSMQTSMGNLEVQMYNEGVYIVQGLINGVASGSSVLAQQMTIMAQEASASFAGAMGIASPSKVMQQHGTDMARGLVLGLAGSQSMVDKQLQQLAAINGLAKYPLGPGGAAGLASEQAAGAAAGVGESAVPATLEVHIGGQEFYRETFQDLRTVLLQNKRYLVNLGFN